MDPFWQAVTQHDWSQPLIKQEFRVYHDDNGRVLFYSMEDVPGNYITIDRHTFEQFRLDVRVKDGKLIKINHDASWKLAPVTESERACHGDDVTVIVDGDYPNKKYWKVITTHEAS